MREFSAAAAKAEEVTGLPQMPPVLDESLRGVGQVVFCNSAWSGAIIAGGLCYADPWLAALAAAGCASATLTARAAGLDAGGISAGLMGYNGALVGCAFAVFLGLPAEPTVAATLAGGAASAFATASLGKVLTSVPQWTLAFNLTAITGLCLLRPAVAAADASSQAAMAFSDLTAFDWCASLLTGVSQIYVVNDPVAGALMLAGIAAYSWGAAAATLLGSVAGVLTAVAFGADAAEVRAGLWGFNPALAALAVSIFFVPLGSSALALAFGGAVAAAVANVWIKGAFAELLQAPACTVPFCLVASVCYLLGGRAPGLVLAARPHSPEENLRAFRAVAAAPH